MIVESKKTKQGFTLMEILIVMAILGFIAAFGLFVSLDFLKTHSFRSEREIIVSLLEKARAQALSNINDRNHGVHFDGNHYIVFQCADAHKDCMSYDFHDPAFDQSIDVSSTVKIITPASPFDIVFSRLSADVVSSKTITIDDGTPHPYSDIKVSTNGQINW